MQRNDDKSTILCAHNSADSQQCSLFILRTNNWSEANWFALSNSELCSLFQPISEPHPCLSPTLSSRPSYSLTDSPSRPRSKSPSTSPTDSPSALPSTEPNLQDHEVLEQFKLKGIALFILLTWIVTCLKWVPWVQSTTNDSCWRTHRHTTSSLQRPKTFSIGRVKDRCDTEWSLNR